MTRLASIARAYQTVFETQQWEDPGIEVGSLSLAEAYEVQRLVIAGRVRNGERPVGYKVGCTSPAIRTQMGLEEPICGILMAPHIHSGDAVFPASQFVQPAVEPEFVIVLARDLSDPVGPEEAIEDAIDSVMAGVEIHHFKFWDDRPTSQELIASNGVHASLVMAKERVRPQDVDWQAAGVVIEKNGAAVASGTAAEIMGGPLVSLRWLVNHLVQRGEGLRAGDIVIPGSPTELVPVVAGDAVRTDIVGVGAVSVQF